MLSATTYVAACPPCCRSGCGVLQLFKQELLQAEYASLLSSELRSDSYHGLHQQSLAAHAFRAAAATDGTDYARALGCRPRNANKQICWATERVAIGPAGSQGDLAVMGRSASFWVAAGV